MISTVTKAAARATLGAAALVILACAPAPDSTAGSEGGDLSAVEAEARIEWGLVIHGGAGTISPETISEETAAAITEDLGRALRAGHAVLADGGHALDAVTAAIRVLEDSPHFNAGKGAVFTADSTNSLDASIMDGSTLRAGAVAGVEGVRNPIELARLVMDSSVHVLLSGDGAVEFARLHGLAIESPEYFHTDRRWQQLMEEQDAEKRGTVGVVALDRSGRLAAGTSTGGMTNKRYGRIGDSPIIGAGTYADAACGVSGTGWGEYFIRNVVAYDICARARYTGLTLAQAAHAVIHERLERQAEDTGGVIALDSAGHVVMPFNTAGMYRGWVGVEGDPAVSLYR